VHIKLFVKEDCPRCPAAKQVVADIDDVEVFDVGEVDGLAEASFHSVMSTPSIVVVDSAGNEVGSWRGEVPDRDVVRSLIAQ
jgi:hypothetical protein